LEGEFIRPDRFDSLSLVAQQGCVASPTQLWRQGGDELLTSPISSLPFFPLQSQWKTVSTSIDVDEDEDFIQFSWINTSRNGNNLWLDNIRVTPDFSLLAPSSFRTSAVSAVGLTLRWTDNSSNETEFVIERSTNGEPFTELVRLPKNTISFVDQSVLPGNTYRYKVFAKGVLNFVSAPAPTLEVPFLITSVKETNTMFHIYPNPASTSFSIENKHSLFCLIEIFSINGIKRFQKELGPNAKLELQSDSLGMGVYLVKLTNLNSTHISKLLVLK
jgi:hypothetical protein